MAGRKIFVGSLPNGITDPQLRAEFGKYGQVEEVFVKQGCDPGRQWAFVTFATQEQAVFAKESCDRLLTFPGADRPCDVMLAKNQGMFGQQGDGVAAPAYGVAPTYPSQEASAPKKIFVGSLPDGITDVPLRAEFSKYGQIEDVYVKPGCELGRQWAFVSFATPEQAQHAIDMTNGILQFAGSMRPCEVTMARNQGMFGQEPLGGGPSYQVQQQQVYAAAPASSAPKKIFVGSLPDGITDMAIRAEFSKYGQITDLFMKQGCEAGRQWCFVTFATPEQARVAKESCDRVLMFPGSERPCEVTMARHQGMFGQDAIDGSSAAPAAGHYAPAPVQYAQAAPSSPVEGPRKIFVGSLPDGVNDMVLRAEFSKYGQIVDIFLKQAAESGRHWAFITFASAEQALFAKDSTDRMLMFTGSEKPCEVMLAKNQGKFGQAPLAAYGPAYAAAGGPAVAHAAHAGYAQEHAQPPPPASPPPAHLTPWRMYKTASGLPYYHNSVTGVTQWEAPPELQAAPTSGVRYSPY